MWFSVTHLRQWPRARTVRRAVRAAEVVLLLVFCGHAASLQADDAKPLAPSAEQVRFFERSVRPILVERCQSCHGPAKQEAGLRLDSRAALLRGSESGPVVMPGRPNESLLVSAVRRQEGLEMPPDKPLKQPEMEALARWVEMGLPWPEDPAAASSRPSEDGQSHWAFQPVGDPPVPEVKHAEWPRTRIDRFILSRLEEAGLQPSAPADRRTLIRRAAFDLLGLPPRPEEVAAFEADDSPNAFEKVVDRLLASPHYGERWGRHWLDVARYADTKGYVFFEEPTFPWAYTYRDYVVQSFNADLPFDRFVLEQMAADRLATENDRTALPALGFLTLGGHFMNNVHDIIDDRIDVVTRGLMGITVTCARCHDHKYDPISQKDYYALYGVFSNSQEPTLPPEFLPSPDTDEYRKFTAEMQAREKRLNDFAAATVDNIMRTARTRIAEYLLAAYALRNQPSTEDFMLLADKGDLNPTIITRWRTYLEKAARRQDPVWTVWHAFARLKEDEFAERAADVAAQWSISGGAAAASANRLVRSAVLASPPASMDDVARRYAELFASIDAKWEQARNNAAGAPPAALDDDAEEALRQVLYGPEGPANIPRVIGWGFLTLLPDRPSQDEYKKLIKDVETWSMTGPGAPPRAMVLQDASDIVPPRVFLRGNPNRLGEEVPIGLPAVAGRRPPFTDGGGRLELARAIIDPQNPLTARVLANRVWLAHFGAGLVTTPSDFGLRGERPSHPALLDHLATVLQRGGWSIKGLHRQILLSAVYQQSSHDRPESRALDPENRLLWRMNRRRLDFEATRDSLLAASGSLDERLGGPPVDLLGKDFVARRTLYGTVDRMNLPGLFTAFDFPSPLSTSPARDATTVPPQALYLMNGPFAAECAARLARRSDVIALPAAAARVERMYALLFGRAPTNRETALANEFLGPRPAESDWQRYAEALLMTNELVYID